MLEHYQVLIKAGLALESFDNFESGQAFLTYANSSLTESMAKLAAVNKKKKIDVKDVV